MVRYVGNFFLVIVNYRYLFSFICILFIGVNRVKYLIILKKICNIFLFRYFIYVRGIVLSVFEEML